MCTCSNTLTDTRQSGHQEFTWCACYVLILQCAHIFHSLSHHYQHLQIWGVECVRWDNLCICLIWILLPNRHVSPKMCYICNKMCYRGPVNTECIFAVKNARTWDELVQTWSWNFRTKCTNHCKRCEAQIRHVLLAWVNRKTMEKYHSGMEKQILNGP